MKEINTKLIKVQQSLKAPKNQYNEFNKFNYRNAEDILEAVKPLLAEHGLLMTISDELQYIGNRYYIKSTVTISDGTDEISTSAYAREDESRAGMSESQVTGCSSSYARKYALQAILLIDDGKDSDSFNNKKPVNQPQQQQPVETDEQRRLRQLAEWFKAKQKEEGIDKNQLIEFKDEYKRRAKDFKYRNYDCDKLWSGWLVRKQSA